MVDGNLSKIKTPQLELAEYLDFHGSQHLNQVCYSEPANTIKLPGKEAAHRCRERTSTIRISSQPC